MQFHIDPQRPSQDAERASRDRRHACRGLRASTRANPYQLTEREFEVLLLLCEGLRNSAIAARLFRSVRTIDHHLAAVFAKLGVASRTEAVATALRDGLRPRAGSAGTRNLGKLALVPECMPAHTGVTAESCR